MNIKSEKGFTIQDLLIAIIILGIFTGVVSSIMISWHNLNVQTIVSGNATYYAIQIMEKIDKVSYDTVTNDIITSWISEEDLNIPSSYTVTFNVQNYNEGNEKEDLIKKVELTISYNIRGSEEKIVLNKLKIKEIES